jgi:hypothetical protein
MFAIQKNVAIPKTIRSAPPSKRKYPFDSMEIGDMFFVPGKTKNTMATHASSVSKKLGKKFKTQLVYMAELEDGSWEPTVSTDEDGVIGIGVWRTE